MNPTLQTASGVSLTVRGLRKSYRHDEVLKGIDLDVLPGEVFVIMGPSGSGKSVLLRHLIGLERPDAGEILVAGEPVRSPELMLNVRLAMVFQSSALLNSLTVGENVGLYLTEHSEKSPEEIARAVADTLDLVGLGGTEGKLPSELSGGMRKRAAIARALIMEPQLILYDEPTSELDPLSAAVVAEEIVSLNRRIGVTSVVVTHDRVLGFGVAHRLALIESGQLLVTGTADEVRQSPLPAVRRFLNATAKPAGKLNVP